MDGEYQLFAGSESGTIFQYTNIESNLTGTFTKLTEDYGELNVGVEIHPTFADIDKDGFLEMAVGNFRGGINFFKTNLKSSITDTYELSRENVINIFPNPVNEQLTIELDSNAKPIRLSIFNALGQVFVNREFSPIIDLSNLDKGVYFIKIETAVGNFSRKFVK